MFKRIDHTEITPGNLERTLKFYTDILGFKVKTRTKLNMGDLEEIAFLTLGDTMLELVGMKKPTPRNPDPQLVAYRMMAIEVGDMDKAIAYLKSKGVEPSLGPMNLPDGSKRAEIKDPDGLGIELRQW